MDAVAEVEEAFLSMEDIGDVGSFINSLCEPN